MTIGLTGAKIEIGGVDMTPYIVKPPRLVMLVPSRGRPESVKRMAAAWLETQAATRADLMWVLDLDDPEYHRYQQELVHYPWMKTAVQSAWTPMVPKLDTAAWLAAESGDWSAIGFMGDDHLPRSAGWVQAILSFAEVQKTGIVYGRDGLQDRKLPTWWVMTSDIIRLFGRMVPAPVQHMYCDNSVKDLGEAADALTYLPHVLIEHMHPIAGKAKWDGGYARVNRKQQYERDQAQYSSWVKDGLDRDAKLLRKLRGGL